MSIELVGAALLAILWLGLIVAVVGFIAMRLRRRALRRGTWPVRIIPWYLGGTPEMRLDAPSIAREAPLGSLGESAALRRGADRRRPY